MPSNNTVGLIENLAQRALHLIANPINKERLETNLQRLVQIEDVFLFIGDATTSLLKTDIIESCKAHQFSIFVLENDTQCRGITDHLPSTATLINDEQMVYLCTKTRTVISW